MVDSSHRSPSGPLAEPAGLRLSSASGRWTLLATILGSSIAMIDGTVVNVALPTIGRDLDAELAGLQWTINGYTLTLAAFILIGGSLGDRYGRRRIFVIGIAWFAIASVLCGLAPSIELLVAGRFLQGVGGALLTPGSLAIISASFVTEDRGRAIGAWSGLGGVAAAVGPFIGGWLVELDWHLIFWINVPLAAITVAVTLRHVPESRDPQATGRGMEGLDIPGAVLGVVGLGGVTAALIEARSGSVLALAAGVVGVAAMVGFVLVELRSAHPMVPPRLFASPVFTAANLATFAIYGALGAILFLLVVQLQVVSGYSALASGVALLPMTVLLLVLSSRAGALSQRIGPRLPMTVGPLLCAGGVLLLLMVGPEANYWLHVLPGVVVFGLGLSLTVAPLTTAVLAAVPSRNAGIASGVNNAVARAASLLAVAVLPVLVGLSGADYQDPGAFDVAFDTSVWICAGLLAVGGVISWLMIPPGPARPADDEEGGGVGKPPPDGGDLSHRRPDDCTHCGIGAPPLAVAPRRNP